MENKDLECKVDTILTNHIPHLQQSITEIKTNVDWLMRFFWVIATASTGALIVGLINLLIKK